MEPLNGYEVVDRYHRDLIRIAARTHDSLYVYWEISARKRYLTTQHFDCAFESLPLNLRVYNVTDIYFHGDNAHRYSDHSVPHESNHKFVLHLETDATYLVDIGVFTFEGQFVPLIRSNAVHLPWRMETQPHASALDVVKEAQSEHVNHRITPKYHENFLPYGVK